jgi:hypothetical protein
MTNFQMSGVYIVMAVFNTWEFLISGLSPHYAAYYKNN